MFYGRINASTTEWTVTSWMDQAPGLWQLVSNFIFFVFILNISDPKSDIYNMRKILILILLLFLYGNMYCFIENFDFTLSSGFTSSRIAGKSIKQSEMRGYKYDTSHGIQYGLSAIYTNNAKLEIEGGARYIEKGYEIYSQHYHYYQYRNHYYYFHRRRHQMFYDEFKASYLDLYAKFKPDFGDGLEMHDLNVKLKPFLGYAHSFLLDSDDRNIDKWDSSLMLGCDIIFSNRFIMGLEYNKGITNIFYDGRADRESFILSLGIVF